ncbi:MAG TPA: peptidylprolyl isomerase [Candidatus Hydrogenedentes bacterium]|nr:peptidylprolyl isomerase [Candidatus Hydrogenedentota bacterium]
MRTIFLLGLFILSPVLSAQESTSPAGSSGVPAVVARIGDEVISGKEFQHDLEYRVRRYELEKGRPATVDTAFRRETLDDLINGRVIRVLAKNAGMTVSDAEVETEFAEGKAALGTEEAFQAYLKREEMTIEALKGEIRNRLMTEKWVAEKTKDITVNDEELQGEYSLWQKEGRTKRETPTADIAHILIRAKTNDAASMDAAKKRVDDLRAKILAGAKFEDVARQQSEDPLSAPMGGMYYEAAADKMLPEVAERMFQLPIGQVSEPFQSRLGWHIMMVQARNDKGEVPFDKMKDRLKNALFAAKKHLLLKQLVDDARKVLNVEIVEAAPGSGENAPPQGK